MNPQLIEKVQKSSEALHQVNVEFYNIWFNDMLFKWHWWLNLAMAIVPWIIWMIIRKKESTYRLLFAGLVAASLSMFLDIIGMAMGLWSYNSTLEPLSPPPSPWDFSLIPVSTMLFLQIKPRVNPLIKAVVLAIGGALIGQPMLEWIGIYDPKGWKHYYSIPIVIIIYLIAHFISTRKQFEKL